MNPPGPEGYTPAAGGQGEATRSPGIRPAPDRPSGRRQTSRAGALEPVVRMLELVERGQGGGVRPHPVQALDAGVGHHRVAEALAKLVLAQFDVEAEQPLYDPFRRGAPAGT